MVLVVKNLPVNAGDIRDMGSIPGLGRSLGGGHGNPIQYSCLENPMDRGGWWATVYRVTKSWTGLKQAPHCPRSSWEQMNLSTTLNIFSRIWTQLPPHLLYKSTYHSTGTIAFIDTGLSFINPIPKIESNSCPHLHPPWDSQNHI